MKAHLNTELSHVAKFQDYPFNATSLQVEAMLRATGVPSVFVRPAAINEVRSLRATADSRIRARIRIKLRTKVSARIKIRVGTRVSS